MAPICKGLLIVALIATAIMTGAVNAAIITPTAAVANTEFNAANNWGNALHLIDATRITRDNRVGAGDWARGYIGTDGWGTWENCVYIDLGAGYSLDEIRIWNYTESDTANNLIGRGVKTSSLWVAGDGATLPTAGVPTGLGTNGFTVGMGWTSLWAGDLNIGETTTFPAAPDQVFDAPAQTPIRYVGLDIDSRWGGDATRGEDGGYPTPYSNYAPGLCYIQVTQRAKTGTIFLIK